MRGEIGHETFFVVDAFPIIAIGPNTRAVHTVCELEYEVPAVEWWERGSSSSRMYLFEEGEWSPSLWRLLFSRNMYDRYAPASIGLLRRQVALWLDEQW